MEINTFVPPTEVKIAPFSKISLDLVLQITDFLPTESVIALALTTKDLYHSQALQNVWKPAIRHFPSRCPHWIAGFSPVWIYCAFCKRLHSRRTTPKITKDWSDWNPCSTDPPRLVWLHLKAWDYHVQFEDVYKVPGVETDWQAPAYNPSLKDPNGYTKTLAQSLTKLAVKPEIANDKLILHTVQRMWYSRDVWNTCGATGLGYPPLACQHEIDPDCLQNGYTAIVPSKAFLSSRFFPPWRPKVSSRMHKYSIRGCDYCLSRHFMVAWDHGKAGIEIGLYTWTDLGICDYDLSPEWILATGDERRRYRNLWPVPEDKYIQDQAVELRKRISVTHSEIGHPSFKRAKRDLALRNQSLHTSKRRSKGRSSQDIRDSSRCQDDHPGQHTRVL